MAKSTILWTTQTHKLKEPVKDPVLGEIQIINVCPYKEVWIYAALATLYVSDTYPDI